MVKIQLPFGLEVPGSDNFMCAAEDVSYGDGSVKDALDNMPEGGSSEGGSSEGGSSVYAGTPIVEEVNTIVSNLSPNVYHKWGSITSLNIQSLASGTTGILDEYMIEFEAANDFVSLALPNTIQWMGYDNPVYSITSGKKYQISIVNGLGVYGEF